MLGYLNIVHFDRVYPVSHSSCKFVIFCKENEKYQLWTSQRVFKPCLLFAMLQPLLDWQVLIPVHWHVASSAVSNNTITKTR